MLGMLCSPVSKEPEGSAHSNTMAALEGVIPYEYEAPGAWLQSASNGTIYASADAARVGGGLYSHLLDAAITLATDPASVVASTGAQLLRVAGVELIESELPPGQPFIN